MGCSRAGRFRFSHRMGLLGFDDIPRHTIKDSAQKCNRLERRDRYAANLEILPRHVRDPRPNTFAPYRSRAGCMASLSSGTNQCRRRRNPSALRFRSTTRILNRSISNDRLTLRRDAPDGPFSIQFRNPETRQTSLARLAGSMAGAESRTNRKSRKSKP